VCVCVCVSVCVFLKCPKSLQVIRVYLESGSISNTHFFLLLFSLACGERAALHSNECVCVCVCVTLQLQFSSETSLTNSEDFIFLPHHSQRFFVSDVKKKKKKKKRTFSSLKVTLPLFSPDSSVFFFKSNRLNSGCIQAA